MDAKLKKKWVAALRSGKYTQTKGFLRIKKETEDCMWYPENGVGYPAPVGYCCLGVLKEIVEGKPLKPGARLLPLSFRKEVGLTMAEEVLMSNKNDHLGWNFKKIATFIEKRKSL